MKKVKHLIVTASNGKSIQRVDLSNVIGNDGSKIYSIDGTPGYEASDLNKRYNELKEFGTVMFKVLSL